MKVSVDTKLYAVMNSNTKELVSRYTGGYFWTRRGDAEAKLRQVSRRGSFELITCGITIENSIDATTMIEKEREILQAKKLAAELKLAEINKFKTELKELTGFTDVSTVKVFLGNTLLVPDYRAKIENVINELQRLKA